MTDILVRYAILAISLISHSLGTHLAHPYIANVVALFVRYDSARLLEQTVIAPIPLY